MLNTLLSVLKDEWPRVNWLRHIRKEVPVRVSYFVGNVETVADAQIIWHRWHESARTEQVIPDAERQAQD